jgi:YD repeat-containing protein
MRWNNNKSALTRVVAVQSHALFQPVHSRPRRLLCWDNICVWLQQILFWLSTFSLSLGLVTTPAHADVSYVYDELGRLVEVVAADGTSTQYSYDAAGNVTGIKKATSTTVSIAEFTPNGGPVGTVVTIYGSGFNTAAASNSVKFNGTTATVSAATATQLTVTVPTGATTGTITVQNGATTATSASSFTVANNASSPTITSFAPTLGNQGTAVTINGTNFQAASADKLSFGSIAAVANTATASAITTLVPTPASSGKISVVTPYGKATSTADFFALPNTVLAANVEVTGRINLDGIALPVTTTAAGKQAVLLLDALAGQRLTLVGANNSFVSGIYAVLYSPSGVLLETQSLFGTNAAADFATVLPLSGTYELILTPVTSTELGSVTLTAVSELNGTVSLDGIATAMTLVNARNGKLTFKITATGNYSIGLNALSMTPTATNSDVLIVSVYTADGRPLAFNYPCSPVDGSTCHLNLPMLTAGTYTVLVKPGKSEPLKASNSFSLWLSTDTSAILNVNTPATANIDRPGRNIRYAFSGTAGQLLSLGLSNFTGGLSSANLGAIIYKPDGTVLGSSTPGITYALPNLPVTGTYSILIGASGVNSNATGTAQVVLALNAITPLNIDGSASIVSTTAASQLIRASLTAVAGGNYGLGVSGASLAPAAIASDYVSVTITAPDGSPIASTACYPTTNLGCVFNLTNTVAGTYMIVVTPPATKTASSMQLWASTDTVGTLSFNTATTANVDRPGRNLRYTFTGTAGQLLSLSLSNLTGGLIPSFLTATINNPDGSYLGGVSISSGTSPVGYALPSLPVTGTYSIFVETFANANNSNGTGTMQVLLTANTVTPLSIDGPASTLSTLVAAQQMRASITTVGGGNYGIGLTNLSMTPATGSSDTFSLSAYKPDGSLDSSTTCLPSTASGCELNLVNTVAGLYSLVITPTASKTATSLQAWASTDISSALTVGTAVTANIDRPGRNLRYTFTGTQAQAMSLALSNLTGGLINTNLTATIRKPDGTILGNSSPGSTYALPTLPVTGTYSMLVEASGVSSNATGTAQVLLVQNTVTLLNIDGAASTVSTSAASQLIRASLAAVAGGSYGLGLNSLSLTPAATASDYVSVAITAPDGSQVASGACYPTTNVGCVFNLTNTLAGNYMVVVTPPAAKTTSSMQLWASTDATGTLSLNTAAAANINRPGRNLRYAFSGSAGQQLGLSLSNATGGLLSASVMATIIAPDGSTLGSTSMAAGIAVTYAVPSLPTAGTYTILIEGTGLNGNATGTLQLSLTQSASAVVNVDGAFTPLSSTTAGQVFQATMTAAAGANYGMGLSSISLTPAATASDTVKIIVTAPDGSLAASANCLPSFSFGCVFNLINTQAGTYTIVLTPPAASTATSMQLWVSTDTLSTIAVNTAATANIDRPGRNVRYSYNGTAGQLLGMALSNATGGFTTGLTLASATIFAPDGTELSTFNSAVGGATATDLVPALLPATGIYTIVVEGSNAYGGNATGTIKLTVSDAVLVSLAPNGAASSASTTLPGQVIRGVMTVTAAGNYGIGLTNLSMTPAASAAEYFNVYAFQPDATLVATTNCTPSTNAGCVLNLRNTVAGSYTIVLEAPGKTASSAQIWVSTDTASTIVLSTAVTANIDRAGRNVTYSFNGTLGQTLSLALSNPSGGLTGSTVSATVISPDGTILGSTTLNAATTMTYAVPAVTLAGTHIILIEASGNNSNAIGTVGVTLSPR